MNDRFSSIAEEADPLFLSFLAAYPSLSEKILKRRPVISTTFLLLYHLQISVRHISTANEFIESLTEITKNGSRDEKGALRPLASALMRAFRDDLADFHPPAPKKMGTTKELTAKRPTRKKAAPKKPRQPPLPT